MRSRGWSGTPKKRRKNGSSRNGSFTRTLVLELMFTTAGVTFSIIGASEGNGWPATSGGRAAPIALERPANRMTRAVPGQKTLDFTLMSVAPSGRCGKTRPGPRKFREVARKRLIPGLDLGHFPAYLAIDLATTYCAQPGRRPPIPWVWDHRTAEVTP